MRKFYLINDKNIRYDLQDIKNSAYLTGPSGLGYDRGLTYARTGNVFKQQSEEPRQATITGLITFCGYDQYQDFINYIEGSYNLRLVYKPIDTEYFRDVDFSGIEKQEKKGHWLSCNIKFNCKSLYYTEDNKRFLVEEIIGEARYPIIFDTIFSDYSGVSVDYNNIGHTEGEIITEIYGYADTPSLELYVNNKLLYKVTFNLIVNVGQKLLYSTKAGDNYVILEDTDGTQTNEINCLSLENDNFFKLPKGLSTIKAEVGTGTIGKVVFRILTSYKGV